MKWIKIEDKVPPEGVNLLYFFDCTGISLGQYYGIEPDYCPETGHVFGSADGWLTGDVTHWMPLPDVPEGAYEEGWELVEEEQEENVNGKILPPLTEEEWIEDMRKYPHRDNHMD